MCKAYIAYLAVLIELRPLFASVSDCTNLFTFISFFLWFVFPFRQVVQFLYAFHKPRAVVQHLQEQLDNNMISLFFYAESFTRNSLSVENYVDGISVGQDAVKKQQHFFTKKASSVTLLILGFRRIIVVCHNHNVKESQQCVRLSR